MLSVGVGGGGGGGGVEYIISGVFGGWGEGMYVGVTRDGGDGGCEDTNLSHVLAPSRHVWEALKKCSLNVSFLKISIKVFITY